MSNMEGLQGQTEEIISPHLLGHRAIDRQSLPRPVDRRVSRAEAGHRSHYGADLGICR
jgi:hypothetical protein